MPREQRAYFQEYEQEHFDASVRKEVEAAGADAAFRKLSRKWAVDSLAYHYPRHFRWLGRPILQFPQDIIAMQELIWKVRPQVIVETGVARGGSLIFYASILKLLGGHGEVIGIEVALRKHNRLALRKHPLARKIRIIDGSSTDPEVVRDVRKRAGRKKVMVVLDSNHTHAHVLEELNLYNGLVRKGSYLIASDTFLEDFPPKAFPNRPWDKGNNPGTAVKEFLKTNRRFVNDIGLTNKLAITACPNGYLRCIRDPQ
jgi:cephalosporin hydroxylase